MKDGYPCDSLCDLSHRFLVCLSLSLSLSLYLSLFLLVYDDEEDECFAGNASEETSKILFVATAPQCLHVCFISGSFSISFSFFRSWV
jgi:hypothetical protein